MTIFKDAQKHGGVLKKPVHRMHLVITEEIKSFAVIFSVTIFVVWFNGLPEDMDLLSILEQTQINPNKPKAGIAHHPAGKYSAWISGSLDSGF